MNSLSVLRQVKDRIEPCEVMIMGLEGWLDAGKAASTCTEYIAQKYGGEQVYVAESDELFNYTVTRPFVRIHKAVIKQLNFPRFEILQVNIKGKNILLVRGSEPHRMWKKLIIDLLKIADMCEAKLILTFGSMLDDITEIKVSAVVSNVEDIDYLKDIGVDTVEYVGPCSFYTPLIQKCHEIGLRGISLWAHVPYLDYYEILARYNMPDWRCSVALLEKAVKITNIDIDLGEAYEKAYEVDSIIRKFRSRGEADSSKYFL